MARLMSVAKTEQAVVERRKTVTRRLGWRFVKVGDRLQLCRKVMGRKPGEPLVRLCMVEVVDVRRELLWDITEADVTAEAVHVGRDDRRFGEWYVDSGAPTEAAWIEWFCDEMDCRPDTEVTRIEWRYLD